MRLLAIVSLFILAVFSAALAVEEKRYSIPLENSPVLGTESAPVTIIEFLDFQ